MHVLVVLDIMLACVRSHSLIAREEYPGASNRSASTSSASQARRCRGRSRGRPDGQSASWKPNGSTSSCEINVRLDNKPRAPASSYAPTKPAKMNVAVGTDRQYRRGRVATGTAVTTRPSLTSMD
jgi:hypothetical protein